MPQVNNPRPRCHRGDEVFAEDLRDQCTVEVVDPLLPCDHFDLDSELDDLDDEVLLVPKLGDVSAVDLPLLKLRADLIHQRLRAAALGVDVRLRRL